MWSQLLDTIWKTEFLFSVIRITAPILFAALGAVIAEKAGVTNIGLEGIMMISALFGVLFSYWTQSWLVGVIGAMLVGVLLGLMMGFFAVLGHYSVQYGLRLRASGEVTATLQAPIFWAPYVVAARYPCRK